MSDNWQKYLTEEERGWLHWAERRRKAGRLMVALRRLAEAQGKLERIEATHMYYEPNSDGCSVCRILAE